MKKTTNYNLLKPGEDDFYDIEEFNQNADIIDRELKKVDKKVDDAVEEIRGEIGDIDLSDINKALDKKVDKIDGKGLSTYDFAKEDKSQIDTNKQDISALKNDKEPLIKNAPVKTSLADADTIPLSDSAAANGTKKLAIANLKAVLKTYFDGFYNKYVHPTYSAWTRGLYKITVDNTGHVIGVSAVTKEDITLLGLLAQEKAPNKNLLVNWDFCNPVNQRGQSSYINYMYSVDRWMITGGRLEIIPTGIRLKGGSTLDQSIDRKEIELLAGKTLTLSLQKTDGTIISGTVTLPKVIDPTNLKTYTAYATSDISLQMFTASNDRECILLRVFTSKDVDIARVKVELGSVSTLVNDPPANFGEQLALCQRYYQRRQTTGAYDIFAIGEYINNGDFAAIINFGIEMRRSPTTTYNGNIIVLTWAGVSGKVKSLDVWSFTGKTVAIVVNAESDTPVGSSGTLRAWEDAEAYIDFDAEIY